eukprot:CAMPEP_0184432810 /NCGR_PEP_ID=MMETSP0738-20130409/364007_1 /TAXON_ID=385413 /ORGANISM="Thalassiosira miniscula, Strain CCMP1093" /LENGTH=63 /DNA_ID=CAMNT_0026798251 /DNA_START=85 /DNA_END=272 /DNA_ORIENTATION=-
MIRLVKGFLRLVAPTIVLAGLVFAAGIPCLGDVVCDDGGATASLSGNDTEPACFGDVLWDDGA